MKRELTETQIENLIELVDELKGKLKKKSLQVAALRGRLNTARRTIKRLKGIVEYQRGRIVKFYENVEIEKRF